MRCIIDILLKPERPGRVERRVTSSVLARLRRPAVAVFAGLVLCGTGPVCAAIEEVSGPRLAAASPAASGGRGGERKSELDQLAYRDGDRVRGHFIKREGDTLVFQSERFGLLRVPAADAEVILAKATTPAAVAAAAQDDKADVDVERAPFSPLALAKGLKEFFGSWHGRFALAAEMMQDSSKHEGGSVDARLTRKWTKDEVQLNARYDYASLDDVTSTDMVKGDGVWRHELSSRWFGVYRPTLEWNRAYYRGVVPSDYVLLQQEAGVGINLFTTDTRKLRLGVSENLFDVWVQPTGTHVAQNVESVFAEIEAKLPWRIMLVDRGVYYYSFATQTEGWENRFEINKKLTETLTIGARHEIRHNNPDVRSADYRRLRVLFGFDF